MTGAAEEWARPPQWFEAAYLAALPKAKAHAKVLCRRRGLDFEDIYAEAMLRGWKSWSLFQEGSNMVAWLKTIVKNHLYVDQRTWWNRNANQLVFGESEEGSEDFRDDAISAFGIDISDRLAFDPKPDCVIDMKHYAEKLMALDPKFSEPFWLHVQGFTTPEVAVECGIEVGTVKSRVSRTRAKILELV
jgi:RNA polymerase sigma-70 factor (ECF subfamily)